MPQAMGDPARPPPADGQGPIGRRCDRQRLAREQRGQVVGTDVARHDDARERERIFRGRAQCMTDATGRREARATNQLPGGRARIAVRIGKGYDLAAEMVFQADSAPPDLREGRHRRYDVELWMTMRVGAAFDAAFRNRAELAPVQHGPATLAEVTRPAAALSDISGDDIESRGEAVPLQYRHRPGQEVSQAVVKG